MAKATPIQFFQQVRQEVAKVTWPTRRETTISTIMVFVMAIIAAIIFFVIDWVLSLAVRFIMGLGS